MPAEETIEIAENRIPYWSRFITPVDLRYDGVNVFRQIFQAGFELPVLDYRRGEQQVTALNSARATARDTILNQANQTRGGAMYEIHGVTITKDGYAYEASGVGAQQGINHLVLPASSLAAANGTAGPIIPTVEDFRGLDSFLYEIFEKNFFMQLSIDGTSRIIEWGPTILHPGQGGPSSDVDTLNGGGFVGNYVHLKEPIYWNPSGTTDSSMKVNLVCAYNVSVPTFTAPTGLAPDGTPIPNANPTPIGRLWSQAWILSLVGKEVKPTSQVS